jgi:hypothetical protein
MLFILFTSNAEKNRSFVSKKKMNERKKTFITHIYTNVVGKRNANVIQLIFRREERFGNRINECALSCKPACTHASVYVGFYWLNAKEQREQHHLFQLTHKPDIPSISYAGPLVQLDRDIIFYRLIPGGRQL